MTDTVIDRAGSVLPARGHGSQKNPTTNQLQALAPVAATREPVYRLCAYEDTCWAIPSRGYYTEAANRTSTPGLTRPEGWRYTQGKNDKNQQYALT